MFTEKQIMDMIDLLTDLNNSTKIYLGCDSIRFRQNGRNLARFATVAIIHMNGKNGCRIFSNLSIEEDYDIRKDRPKLRMLNEVRKVCELYHQLIPFIDEYDVEIHLDISQDAKNGSNCAASEAAGYVLGLTGIEPKLKPDAFASSFGSDWVVNGGTY